MDGLARGIRGFGAVGASLAVLGLCGSGEARAEQGAPTVLGTCAGQDWSLSEKIEPLPDTGLFTMGAESDHEIVAHRGHTLTWAELNPARGVYDWAPVEKLLSRAERDDYGVVLRLKSSVVDRRSPWGDLAAVPQWVLDETDPPIARVRDRGRKNYTDIVVPWDEHVQAAYLEFVRAFGEQDFHRHRRLLGLYVHGISTSWGEEFWLDEGAVAALQPHGLSPERLRETFGARIEAWAHAFGAEAGRLAWVGTGWIAAGKEWRTYRKMGDELDDHALALGLGQRWGHNEAYNKRLDQSGQELSKDGVLRTNPDFPMLAEGRYWGGENEIWKGRRSEAFDYRRATVRAMQMQMRLLWVNDAGISLDPEIARYFTQVAGPRTHPTPGPCCARPRCAWDRSRRRSETSSVGCTRCSRPMRRPRRGCVRWSGPLSRRIGGAPSSGPRARPRRAVGASTSSSSPASSPRRPAKTCWCR
jgi:hypothetical protein